MLLSGVWDEVGNARNNLHTATDDKDEQWWTYDHISLNKALFGHLNTWPKVSFRALLIGEKAKLWPLGGVINVLLVKIDVQKDSYYPQTLTLER